MSPELIETINAALNDGLTVELERTENGAIVATVITREEVL